MLLFSFVRSHSSRRRILRWSCVVFVLGLFLSLSEVYSVHSALVRSAKREPGSLASQRIFIASIHWNNEKILREHWIPAVIALTKELGPGNVFVSVKESGSWDDSKGALRALDQKLAEAGVPRKIVLDDTTHIDEISKLPGAQGWIKTPRGKTELRRIPYLAKLRNEVLQPLYDIQNASKAFDRILFLNDVVFQSSDIRKLLSTRGGDYAAACALDFAKPPAFYDTFALRDSEGNEAVMQEWPYFRSRASRAALKEGKPTPVTSCWNGIVAMDAESFFQQPRLAFRGVPDSLAQMHVEGSECCLIHADNHLTPEKGVWLHPNVRVGYSPRAYEAVNPVSAETWISKSSIARGLWVNRITRWFTSAWFKELVIQHRLRQWRKRNASNQESGSACLINEMQVLVANGWAHV